MGVGWDLENAVTKKVDIKKKNEGETAISEGKTQVETAHEQPILGLFGPIYGAMQCIM